ncbi:hypothetical protein N7510_011845 [Penicillium lagena]|uniref:uncharacterized protein n=1 Tax=Penicillium lagena TaxID=94218 RepID=UPI0025413D73|nr:uncharacterized protein N7510_011845 [Penicillium lagena]KAJ5598895.1 hypothetical protein N7510_011845 [Penicillium lagena]
MRLEYTSKEPKFVDEADQQILTRVLKRRGGSLIPLDRTLLHAPSITDGFNAFMIALRTRNSLPDDVREIAFCRVASLTGCWYEWEIHSPIAAAAGVSQDGLQTLRDSQATGSKGLSDRQLSVVYYADAMTKAAKVPEEVFKAARTFFNNQQMVELTATIAGFNMVARFCVALDVGENNDLKEDAV